MVQRGNYRHEYTFAQDPHLRSRTSVSLFGMENVSSVYPGGHIVLRTYEEALSCKAEIAS